jgi:Domain of unknown function (DUF4145)
VASRVCYHCNVKAHHARVGAPLPTAVGNVWMAAFRCDECGVLSVGALDVPPFGDDDTPLAKHQFDRPESDIRWLPDSGLGKTYDGVPPHIAGAASESHQCDSVGAYRAAVLMARAVVEATAKDQGITNGQLADKIDKMHERGLIRELVKDQAHEVRHLGNEMAHGDFVDAVTKEESAEILELMAEVLREVYQAPARLKVRKDARLSRAQANSAPTT